MKNDNFTTTILVDQTAAEVFDAVNNVRGWWSENIDGDTNQLNSEFLYHYQDVHRCKIKITGWVPGKKVVWHILDNYFNFTKDKSEWKDTHVIFDISEKDGQTQLTLTHVGLVPEYECYPVCHDAWTHYIQGSLKDLIVTGKGKPTPKEVEDDDDIKSSIDTAKQTNGKSIYHSLVIEAPVETVYEATTTQKGLAGGGLLKQRPSQKWAALQGLLLVRIILKK